MDNTIIIRPAAEHEIQVIIALANRIWPVTYQSLMSNGQLSYMMQLFYSEDSLKEQFNHHQFLLAFLGEEPVGFASYGPSSDSKIYKLHKLYVLPDLQGRGMGRELILFIADAVKTFGAETLELNVKRDNKARSFYEKLGFDIVREEDIDIGNNFWMRDYVMRLQLGA